MQSLLLLLSTCPPFWMTSPLRLLLCPAVLLSTRLTGSWLLSFSNSFYSRLRLRLKLSLRRFQRQRHDRPEDPHDWDCCTLHDIARIWERLKSSRLLLNATSKYTSPSLDTSLDSHQTQWSRHSRSTRFHGRPALKSTPYLSDDQPSLKFPSTPSDTPIVIHQTVSQQEACAAKRQAPSSSTN